MKLRLYAAFAAALLCAPLALGQGWTEQDFSTLLLQQAEASGLKLKPENVEVGDGLS